MQNLYQTPDDFTKTLNETCIVAEILADITNETKARYPNTISHAKKLLDETLTMLVMEPEETSVPVAKRNLKDIQRMVNCIY